MKKTNSNNPRNNQASGSNSNSNSNKKPHQRHDAQSKRSAPKREPNASISTQTINKQDHPVIMALKVEESSAEPCGVCFEHTKYHAAYPCGHTAICYKCSLRLRALMKERKCPLCRTESKDVIISSEKGRSYKDLLQADKGSRLISDSRHGILFESEEAKRDVLKILDSWCPYAECYEKGNSPIIGGFAEMQGHLHAEHGTMLCDLCYKHKHLFSVEYETYTRPQLQRHIKDGGPTGRQEGFKGHPRCGFCNSAFYSDDELFQHCRKKHESCFICDRAHPGRPIYFKNYTELEDHFSLKHFLCGVAECREQKFVVFGTKIELQDHMVSEHPNLVGSNRAARKVELDFPSLGAPAQGGSTTSSGHTRSAPLSRVAPRSIQFDDAQFPALGADGATANGSASSSTTSLSNAVQSHSHVVQMNAGATDSELAPENMRATQMRRLDERARNYLKYDGLLFVKFKDINEYFYTGEYSASRLIEEYHQLFDSHVDSEQFEVLIESIANLSSVPKKKALLEAFYGQQVKNDQNGSVKHEDAKQTKSWVSSRSLVGTQAATASSANHFPALPGVTASASSSSSAASGGTSFSSLGSGPSRASTLGRSRVIGATVSTKKPAVNLDESFPALPKKTTKSHPRVNPVVPVRTVWGTQGQEDTSKNNKEPEDSMAGLIGGAQVVKKGKKIVYRI